MSKTTVSFKNLAGVEVTTFGPDKNGDIVTKAMPPENINGDPTSKEISQKPNSSGTKIKHEENANYLDDAAKVFTQSSDWPSILGRDSSFKSTEEAVNNCIANAQEFVRNISKQNLLSFNCQDLNEICFGDYKKDPKILVIKFENSELDQEELFKIILPVFLAMANIFTPSKHEDQTTRDNLIKVQLTNWRQRDPKAMLDNVLDEIDEIPVGQSYVQNLFDDAKKLHEDILSNMQRFIFAKKEGGGDIKTSFAVNLMGDIVSEHINASASGNIEASHVKSKKFAELKGDTFVELPIKPPTTTTNQKNQTPQNLLSGSEISEGKF